MTEKNNKPRPRRGRPKKSTTAPRKRVSKQKKTEAPTCCDDKNNCQKSCVVCSFVSKIVARIKSFFC